MSALNQLFRNTILSVANWQFVRSAAHRYGWRLGAGRFVAGEDLATALERVAELNADGIMATLDHLGEFVSTPEEARAATDACIATLDGIARSGVNCNLSLKLTSLGLDIDRELCERHMRLILDRAVEHDNFVRIDMEDSPRTEVTLQLFERLVRDYGPARIGTVIQAYLHRSRRDLEWLAGIGANLRLVKGAYMEPATVAYQSKAEVDTHFIQLIEQYLGAGMYTAVATHDERAIAATEAFVQAHGIARDRFEFQMLYGIRRDLQRRLAEQGYRVRVYVPYGQDWYGYFTRRLAERPANVWFVLSNLFKS